MYTNKATINTTASAYGGSNFSTNFYWSSTENYGRYAWGQDLYGGGQYYYDKDSPSSVRAVRAF